MTVVRLDPDENGATSNWNAEGAKAKWEEVAQTAMQQGKRLKDGSTEEEAQTLKKPTEAEAKARGVKITTTNSVVVQQFRVSAAQVEAKIPVGAVIKRIAWRVFEKPVSTQVTNTLEVGNWAQEAFMSGTVEAFQNFLALKERIEETTRAKLIEKCQVALATPGTGTGESRASVVYLEVEYEAGGATPAILPFAAAESSASATLAVNAPTLMPLAGGASASEGTLAVFAPTRLPLVAAASSSGASLAVTAPTQVPMAGGASVSAAALAVFAPTQLPLAAASGSSAASLSVTAKGPVKLELGSAASGSSGVLAVTAPTALVFAPGASTSTGGLTLQVPAVVSTAGGVSGNVKAGGAVAGAVAAGGTVPSVFVSGGAV